MKQKRSRFTALNKEVDPKAMKKHWDKIYRFVQTGVMENKGERMKTNVQMTSLEAYEEAKRTLGDRQMLVFRFLRDIGSAATNTEIANALNWSINTVTPRIFELRQKGLVVPQGKRPCLYTGKKAIAWRIKRAEESKENQLTFCKGEI